MNSTQTQSPEDVANQNKKDFISSKLNLLFQPRHRSIWLKQLTKPSNQIFDNWISGSDEELMQYLEQVYSDNNEDPGITLIIISAACSLGIITYDTKWHFTDIMWDIANQMSKEGIDWEQLNRDQLLNWFIDPKILGRNFDKKFQNAWKLINPKATQFLIL